MQLCFDKPIPDFPDLHNMFSNLPKNFMNLLPSLPSMPKPFIGSFNIPNISLPMYAGEFHISGLFSLVDYIIGKFLHILGLGLELIPKIPILDISLSDLLSGDGTGIWNMVKQKISEGIDLLASLIPKNLIYPSFTCPDMEILHTIGIVLRNYFMILVNFIVDLITDIINMFHLPGLHIPTMPSWSEVVNYVKGMLGFEYDTGEFVFPDFPNPIISPPITIPGFPNPIFNIPEPYFKTFTIPALKFMDLLKNMFTAFVTYILNIIINFINTVLSFLNLVLPLFCITVPISEIPNIPTESQLPPTNSVEQSVSNTKDATIPPNFTSLPVKKLPSAAI